MRKIMVENRRKIEKESAQHLAALQAHGGKVIPPKLRAQISGLSNDELAGLRDYISLVLASRPVSVREEAA